LGYCDTQDKKHNIPQWLWAIMRTEDYDAYLKEILKCKVIIYDITDDCTQERLDEVRAVCDGNFFEKFHVSQRPSW